MRFHREADYAPFSQGAIFLWASWDPVRLTMLQSYLARTIDPSTGDTNIQWSSDEVGFLAAALDKFVANEERKYDSARGLDQPDVQR